jgi:hypothetical protein
MRMLRRPDGQITHNEEDSHESQYSMATQYEEQEGTGATIANAAAEPYYQLLAEGPNLDEAAAVDGLMLSSVELDSLLGPYEDTYDSETDPQRRQERMLLEISNAVLSAVEGCYALAADDVWHDQWFKPALGVPTEPTISLYQHGGNVPRHGELNFYY